MIIEKIIWVVLPNNLYFHKFLKYIVFLHISIWKFQMIRIGAYTIG